MRFDGKKNPQAAKGLKISKLSSVKRPAHAPALSKIIKSAEEESKANEEIAKRMFNEAMESMGMDDTMRAMMREAYRMSEALQSSFHSIITNPEYKEKKNAMKESIAQFVSALTDKIDENTTIKEYKTMPKDAGKKKKDDLTEDEKMKARMKKEAEDEVADRLFKAEAMMEMNDREKAYFKSLPEAEQESFIKSSFDERAQIIKKAEEGDETLIVKGVTLKKSECPGGLFEIMKAQQEEISLSKKDAKVEKEARIMKEFEDRAEKEFPNVPGTVAEKALMLKSIEEMPEAARNTALAALKSSNESLEIQYEELGVNAGNSLAKTSEEKMETLAKSISEKEPNLSFDQAYAKAMRSPEGQRIYAGG